MTGRSGLSAAVCPEDDNSMGTMFLKSIRLSGIRV